MIRASRYRNGPIKNSSETDTRIQKQLAFKNLETLHQVF